MSGSGARQSRNLVPGQRVRSLALMCLAISCATDCDGGRSQEVDLAGMTIVYASDGQEHLPLIERYLVDGRQRVEDFFGSPFRKTFMVRIFPDRATLTEHWGLDWSGPYRYAVSGTLVAYIDEIFGRDVLNNLMTMSTQVEILDALGMSETELFANWGQHLLRGSG